jgi:hypothetical protein
VAVETSLGRIDCDYFVNSAGFWSRLVGELSTPHVAVPIHPFEHYHLHTKPAIVDPVGKTATKMTIKTPRVLRQRTQGPRSGEIHGSSPPENSGLILGHYSVLRLPFLADNSKSIGVLIGNICKTIFDIHDSKFFLPTLLVYRKCKAIC